MWLTLGQYYPQLAAILISLFMDEATEHQTHEEATPATKFSFLQRILNYQRDKYTPGSLSLRPIKNSRLSQRGQTCEQSAKEIIKRSIFKDGEPRVIGRKNDNFLMKGKMLNGVKKPIENQMASLLKNINDRIAKEIEKNETRERNVDLPIIPRSEQTKEQQPAAPPKRPFTDIFKNLREVRSKKAPEEYYRIAKSKNLSDFNNNTEQNTINSQCGTASKKTAPASTASDRRSPRLEALSPTKQKEPFKKGYLAYDEAGKAFLDTYRSNIVKKYEKQMQKFKQLTAKSFIVVDYRSLMLIAGKSIDQSIEIASISKVMTCYLVLLVCRKYSIDIYHHNVRISEKAAQTPGTTAELQPGDVLTVYQLLLALMLPSGNDASVALAQSMGKVIQRNKTKETKKSYYETFISHMNILSKQMNLTQTWSNSSGLGFNPNYSTPEAITLLTAVAMRHELFAKIVNTRSYDLEVKNDRYGLTRSVTWKNTNKLLQSGWQGVKTGTTETAGHCLMAKKDHFLIAVFSCQTLARRFSQCVYLYEKYQNHEEQA